MRGAVPLGRLFGVRIRLHVTFLLILAWFAWLGWQEGGPERALWALVLVVLLFFCVVLHELGHSLMARRFGAEVRSITLLPIGGVAQLKAIPERPRHELLVALSGPAVNVALVALLVWIRGRWPAWRHASFFPRNLGELADALIRANVVLAAFNLLPAFPMDGGRILRSVLARFLGFAQATAVASTVGQGLAVLFILVGLFHSPVLVVIGLFVLWGAQTEGRFVRVRELLRDVVAQDVMLTDFAALEEEDRIGKCLEYVYHRRQEDFPVLRNGQLVGVLPRRKWLAALHSDGPDVKAGEIMERRFMVLDVSCPLARLHPNLWAARQGVYPVVQEGRLVGLITAEDVGRYLMVQEARPPEPLAPPEMPAAPSRFTVDLG